MIAFLESAVRAFALNALVYLPTAFWRKLFPKTAVGLCYHVVSDLPLRHVKHYQPLSTCAFEGDLKYLQEKYSFVSYDQLVQRRNCAIPARDNPVVLTFDDGFNECARVVAPILLRREIPCIFFVITDLIDNNVIFRESAASLCIEAVLRLPVERVEALIQDLGIDAVLRSRSTKSKLGIVSGALKLADFGGPPHTRIRPLLHWLLTITPDEVRLLERLNDELGVKSEAFLEQVRPYLSTQQIRRLRLDGFTIGAHSCSHRMLQELSRAEAEHEIAASCKIVQNITNQDSVPFSFPYFGGGIDRNWLAEIRRKHNVIGLFFDTNGLREDDPCVVQRCFGERYGPDQSIESILRRAWARPSAWRR